MAESLGIDVIVADDFTPKMPDDEKSTESHLKDEDLHSVFDAPTRKRFLRIVSFIGMLTPFTDTVYLPVLAAIQTYFSASETEVALSVSLYMATASIGQLCFGPVTDRYGRVTVILTCLVFFEMITIACIFAPTVQWLVALRSIQGFCVSGTIVAAQATIVDIFPKEELGTAMSAFYSPILIGPVIAPLIGGAVGSSPLLSWRAVFVLLAAMAGPAFLLVFLGLRETHPYYVYIYKRLAADTNNGEIGSSTALTTELDQSQGSGSIPSHLTNDIEIHIEGVVDDTDDGIKNNNADAIPNKDNDDSKIEEVTLPELLFPWGSLLYLVDPKLSPYYAVASSTFGVMFTSLTIFPLYAAAAPYNLSPAIIGVAFLPYGAGTYLGAAVGGVLSDISLRRHSSDLDGRMTLLFPIAWLTPVSSIAFGFCLEYGVSLGLVLAAQFVLGFSQAALMPSTNGYLSSVYPERTGTVGSLMLSSCFASAAICIPISVLIANAIGVHLLFVIIAAMSAACILYANIVNAYKVKSIWGLIKLQ